MANVRLEPRVIPADEPIQPEGITMLTKKPIRTHLRSNVVGYVALFVALSGTAVALPVTNTVFSDDIVNGQVTTQDISDSNGVRSADVRDDDKNGGGLAAIDLARGSVGSSEIATDGVASPEIKADAVRGSEIATDGVGSPEIELKSLRGPKIATDAIGRIEIAANAVGASEIGTDSVGKDAIGIDEVGANELDEVHEHDSEEAIVEDGTAHDGAYGIGSVRVACLFDDEDLLSVSIDWIDTNQHSERMLADVEIDRGVIASEADAAVVSGAFDGGGGAANPAKFIAHATCLQS